MNFLTLFIISNVINVTLSTIKTIVTANGGKWSASFINALTYGFYTVVIVLTADTSSSLNTFEKALIIGGCNLVCVWIVKLVEEKRRKEKLWKIELTINNEKVEEVIEMLRATEIPFNYIEGIGKYTIFNIFCSSQKQSGAIKEILKNYDAKYFVSESKTL